MEEKIGTIKLIENRCTHCNSYNIDVIGHSENCPLGDKRGNSTDKPIIKTATKKYKLANIIKQMIRTIKSQEERIKALEAKHLTSER